MRRRLRRLFGGTEAPTDDDATGDAPSSTEPTPDVHAGDTAPATEPTVALFVDGPNVFRDEFDVDLADLREAAAAAGQLGVARCYLNEHATPGLVQAAEAHGFEVVVTSGDVDVKLAVDATECAVSEPIDVVAIASRDTDFKPVLEKAGKLGVRTLAIAPGEHGRSDALRNAANDAVVVEK